jgi:hypothetical protein
MAKRLTVPLRAALSDRFKCVAAAVMDFEVRNLRKVKKLSEERSRGSLLER